jgi:hypothetical protein
LQQPKNESDSFQKCAIFRKVKEIRESRGGVRSLRLKAQGLRLRVNNKAISQLSCLMPCALRLMPSAYAADVGFPTDF